MNGVKGRSIEQAVAVGCLPQHVEHFAEVERSKPLLDGVRRFSGKQNWDQDDLVAFLATLCNESLGLILHANGSVPDHVSMETKDGRTVLVMAANGGREDKDVYNQTLLHLATEYGTVIAGTSANLSGKSAYAIFEHRKLQDDLRDKPDAYAVPDKQLNKPRGRLFAASSTIIDLTQDVAIVRRQGSQHPYRFRRYFPHLRIPKDTPKEEHAEGRLDFFGERILTRLKSAVAGGRG